MAAVRSLFLALAIAAGNCAAAAPASLAALPQAAPAGATRLTYWGFEVYDAQLWVAPGFRRTEFAAHPLALQLSYLRSFKGADIARRSLQEMQRASAMDPAKADRWQEQLRQLLPDVARGDRLTGVHRPDRGAEFFKNGQRLGEIADPEFSRRFFSIWLGPASPEPGMREALLAGTAQ